MPTNDLETAIQGIKKNREEYKKHANEQMKDSFLGKILAYFGIDLGDPSQNSVLYKALRFTYDIKNPDEGDFEGKDFEYEDNTQITEDVIEPFLSNLSRAPRVPIKISELEGHQVSQKAKSVLDGSKKIGSEPIDPSVPKMAEDIMGRIPESKIVYAGKSMLKIDLSGKNALTNRVKMKSLMAHKGGINLDAMNGMFSGVIDEFSNMASSISVGGIGDKISSTVSSDDSLPKDTSRVENARLALGYPKITDYSINDKNIAVISFDTTKTK